MVDKETIFYRSLQPDLKIDSVQVGYSLFEFDPEILKKPHAIWVKLRNFAKFQVENYNPFFYEQDWINELKEEISVTLPLKKDVATTLILQEPRLMLENVEDESLINLRNLLRAVDFDQRAPQASEMVQSLIAFRQTQTS